MSFSNKYDNVFGGENVFVDGNFIGSTRPNIFGGSNVFDGSGNFSGFTQENILGGDNMFSSTGQMTGHTQESIMGTSIYNGSGTYDGFVSSHGDMTTAFDAFGGVEAINMGGSIIGDVDLDPDALIETLTTFI